MYARAIRKPVRKAVRTSVTQLLGTGSAEALAPVDSLEGKYFPMRNTAADPVSPSYTAHAYTFVPNDGLYFSTTPTNFYKLFFEESTFEGDPDMALWDVSRITSINRLLHGASLFNIDLSGWVTSAVTNFYMTFKNATLFNQDLSQWDVSSSNGNLEFSAGSALTPEHLPTFR